MSKSKLTPKYTPIAHTSSDPKEQQYQSFVKKYLDDEYFERLGLNNIKTYALRKMLIERFNTAETSQRRVLSNVDDLIYKMLFHKTHMTVTIFKLTKKGSGAIYCTLYSYAPTGEHMYFTAAPAYSSMDGEYRPRVLPVDHIENFRKKYPEIYEHAETTVTKHIDRGDWRINTLIYYPSDVKVDESAFEQSIKESRLAIKTLILAWLQDFRKIHLGTIENHVNNAYRYVIYDDSDIPVYEWMVKFMGDEKVMDIMMYDAHTYHSAKLPRASFYNYTSLQTGQKYISTTVHEFKSAANLDKLEIKYGSWRELYVGRKCSNLVVNYICPSFAVFGDWFFIQNTNKDMFDNLEQMKKYDYSMLAAEIKNELKAVDKKNRQPGNLNQFHNNKFAKISEDIRDTIRHLNQTIILSDTTTCLISEYVGHTIKDTMTLLKNKWSYHYMRPALEDVNKFSKHIFEFLYAFLCMNMRLGMLHGDTHVNNATFHRYHMYVTKEIDKPIVYRYKNPKVLYILDSNRQYLFDHIGYFSMLIDFSRALIGPNSPIVEEYGEDYLKSYFELFPNLMLNTLNRHLPSYASSNHEMLEQLAHENPQLFFKILTAIDSFAICRALDHTITQDLPPGASKVNLDQRIVRLLRRVLSQAEKLVIDNFNKALMGDLKLDTEIEWPNLSLIKEFFEEFRVTEATSTDFTIMDVFNFLGDMKYDMYDPTRFPVNHQVVDIEFRKKFGLSTEDAAEQMKNFSIMSNTKSVEILVHQVIDTGDTAQVYSDYSSSWLVD